MTIFDTYKTKLLLKKVKAVSTKREICIPSIDKYYSVLILLDQNDSIIKNELASIFKNSKISTLYNRTTKELPSAEDKYTYSYHKSDLGFGKIKRERLLGLLHSNFDLVIDFSINTTEFNYFVKKSKSTLKIGDLHSTKNYLYDLLVDRSNSDSNFIENIKLQINTLSQ
jgi:hypothetical protein